MEASATRSLPAASPPPFEGDDEKLLVAPDRARRHDRRARRGAARRSGTAVPVPVEFVARSHLPLLEYDAQVEVMQQLAEGVAPHV